MTRRKKDPLRTLTEEERGRHHANGRHDAPGDLRAFRAPGSAVADAVARRRHDRIGRRIAPHRRW